MIPSFTTGKITFSSISREQWKSMKENAIKHWHFEKRENGMVPVADNPIEAMTPLQRTEYNRLCTEQGKCWKRIADLESEKLALLSEHRGWKYVWKE